MHQHLRDTDTVETIAGKLDPADAAAWDRMVGDALVSAAFVDVCQRYPGEGFGAGTITFERHGDLLAGAQFFTHEFRVDMPFGGRLKAFGDLLLRFAPRFVRLPMLALGSPLSDTCAIVVDPAFDAVERRQAYSAIIDRLVALAAETHADVIAVKDLPGAIAEEMGPELTSRGFSRTDSLPLAVLELPFASVDGYLASLSPKMRADLRRKQRQSKGRVEIAMLDDASGMQDEIERLFEATRSRRKADYGDFDAMPHGFMSALLRALGRRAHLVVSRVEGEVAGFNLFLAHGDTAVAYRIGLDGDIARENNLYFLNWLWMVEYCIANSLKHLVMGQTSYRLKLRLGCRLEPSWIYFRHRSAAWNQLFKVIAPRVSIARMDTDLRAAASGARFPS